MVTEQTTLQSPAYAITIAPKGGSPGLVVMGDHGFDSGTIYWMDLTFFHTDLLSKMYCLFEKNENKWKRGLVRPIFLKKIAPSICSVPVQFIPWNRTSNYYPVQSTTYFEFILPLYFTLLSLWRSPLTPECHRQSKLLHSLSLSLSLFLIQTRPQTLSHTLVFWKQTSKTHVRRGLVVVEKVSYYFSILNKMN